MKEIRAEFFNDAAEQLARCEESYLNLERPELREEELNKIFRLAHSMKSGGAMLGIMDLSEFAHKVEDLLSIYRGCPGLLTEESISLLLRAGDAIRTKVEILRAGKDDPWDTADLKQEIQNLAESLNKESAQAKQRVDADACATCPSDCEDRAGASHPAGASAPVQKTSKETAAKKSVASREPLRIDPLRVDAVLDLVGELVVLKGQLLELRLGAEDVRENEVLSLIDKTARELQERALAMRLTAIKPLMVKIRRGVRDLSLALNKPIELEIVGEDLELDRTMVENLGDPLMHLIRNAVDHGLETSSEREAAGKSKTGHITLSVRQAGGKIVIELRDDGRGINKEKVLKRAMERGLVADGTTNISDSEAYEFLFHPGFSTAEKVTDLSGRGVGLDVVKSNIVKLRGSINIESSLGVGTCFQLVLPLTAAIVDGILVKLEEQRFVVPMLNIVEIVRINDQQVRELPNRSHVATVRGFTVPLINVERAFPGIRQDLNARGERTILILECAKKKIGIMVDAVLGQSQVVVKSMGGYFGERPGLAGASIMGDGRVGLVLDVETLVKDSESSKSAEQPERKAA